MDGCGKISIIIPAFNAEKSIGGCIESIICQTYCNLQIIIVDDGSSDGTLSVCSKYAAEDDRITVIGQPNGGPSVARNAALKVADGDYLMFADADDRLSDNEACAFLVGTLEESGADAMFYSAAVYENGACVGRVTAGEDEVVCADGVIDGIISDDSSFGGGYPWNKLWKISGEVCQFDADLFAYEDKKWVLEQLQSCQKVYLGKRVCYNYYRSGHSLSRDVAREARRLKSIVAAYGRIYAMFKDGAHGRAARIAYNKMVLFAAWAAYRGRLNDVLAALKEEYSSARRSIAEDGQLPLKERVKCALVGRYLNNMRD